MTYVYVLFHSYGEEELNEEIKIIGVFSEEKIAKDTIEEYKSRPGFKEYPHGFHISKYKLNQKWWSDGFVLEKE